MAGPRRLETLSRDEALRLLGSVPIGRVVFSHLALPAVRPVPHLVDGPRIVVRVGPGSAITAAAGAGGGAVVAYEADAIDPAQFLGWSVVVVGRAVLVTDGLERARYRQALPPWVTGARDDLIAIRADMVDGFRLVLDTGTSQQPPAAALS